MSSLASLAAQTVKHLSAMQETQVQSLGWEDPLEKEMAAHFSILAWEISWTEAGLQSMESQELDLLGDQTTTTYNSNFMLFTSEHVDLYSLKVKVKLLSCVQLFATP